MDVVCRKYSCEFNDRAKCARKHLKVDAKSVCDDLKADNTKIVEDVSRDMFEHEPDVAPYHHCKTMEIKCDASTCLFNKEGVCFSNGVFVGSAKINAPCNSYVPR